MPPFCIVSHKVFKSVALNLQVDFKGLRVALAAVAAGVAPVFAGL
jgi:hypothetical protein